ncbi:MAG TPA: hypothetical protein VHH33_01605 [Nitrososphaeraceae archaeon]|nr:hypothetical protein [Nitrososphaeraceae archaeon]
MDFWSFVRDYAQTITAGGVIVALFISFYTLLSQRKHSKYQRLIEVYKLVNTFEEREARKNVYEAFRIYMEHHYRKGIKIGGKMYFSKNLRRFKGEAFIDIFRDPVVLEEMKVKGIRLQQDVERVRSTFDHIGVLYNSNLVPKEPLLKALWGTGRVCWICLAQNIFIERDKMENESYMNNFEDFFYEIEKYRNRQRPILVPVGP